MRVVVCKYCDGLFQDTADLDSHLRHDHRLTRWDLFTQSLRRIPHREADRAMLEAAQRRRLELEAADEKMMPEERGSAAARGH